jgi:hypothetical protein
LAAVGTAHAQLGDGNFDALAIGTPPDCATPAGAWQFPATYVSAALCEVDPNSYTIVATNSFQSGAAGNSLALSITDAVNNFHLTNILPAPIVPGAGQIVRCEFDLWVQATGGGGTVYIGADMGGGGYSNASDRGPQISWALDGTLEYNSQGTLIPLVTGYPRSAWQHVRLDIHLDTSNFDFYWTPPGGPQQTLGTGLLFRVTTPITMIDRFSIAHFGGTAGLTDSHSYFDNVTLALLVPATCYPNCDGSTTQPCLNVLDFSCFLNAFAAGASYANCDNSTTQPILNVLDFSCFLNRFAAGCSSC